MPLVQAWFRWFRAPRLARLLNPFIMPNCKIFLAGGHRVGTAMSLDRQGVFTHARLIQIDTDLALVIWVQSTSIKSLPDDARHCSSLIRADGAIIPMDDEFVERIVTIEAEVRRAIEAGRKPR
ncbi:MAG: hypothetical protein R3B49_04115 [Phycisphaerales bacterium]